MASPVQRSPSSTRAAGLLLMRGVLSLAQVALLALACTPTHAQTQAETRLRLLPGRDAGTIVPQTQRPHSTQAWRTFQIL
jgi:hypothetical protein